MLRTVFIPDLHLERLLSLLPNHISESEGLALQLRAVRQILLYCRKNGIKYVIQLGDVFHTASPKQSTIVALLLVLWEFPDIHIFFIPGNHDYVRIGQHSQQIMSHIGKSIKGMNLTVFDQPTIIKLDDVPIYFCPWPYTEAPTTPHLCIGHFDINGLYYANGATVAKRIDRQTLGKDNIWIVGHNHTPQYSGRIYNPGTLYQVYTNEHANKKVLEVMVEFNDRLMIKPTWHDFKPPYILRNIEYNNEEDLLSITSTPNTYWLVTANPLAPPLPSKWLLEHPNVLNRMAQIKSKSLPTTIGQSAVQGFSPLFLLEDFLKEKGLSPQNIADGIAIVNAIIKDLNPSDAG